MRFHVKRLALIALLVDSFGAPGATEFIEIHR